jgi:diadenosine tetraphosphate (Ap4A) HIT family hydrolase
VTSPDACLVCRELRGEVALPGGFVHEDGEVAAFHVPPVEELGTETVYLGHLMIVTRRHVARLGDLSEDESAAVGAAASRLARALAEAAGADWVFAAVIGTGVPHFHQHLVARYPDTPRDLPWHAVDEWDGARKGGPAEIAGLVERLKASARS